MIEVGKTHYLGLHENKLVCLGTSAFNTVEIIPVDALVFTISHKKYIKKIVFLNMV